MHPLARKGLGRDHVAQVIGDAILRHEAILTADEELAKARRELVDAEDDRWFRAVAHVGAEKRAADQSATKQKDEDPRVHPRGDVQRMLAEESWRRPKQRARRAE